MKKPVPAQEPCARQVTVPTIFTETQGPPSGIDEFVSVQWFGIAQGVELDLQFRFPLPLSWDRHGWMGEFTDYEVVFLGQVRDWPAKTSVAMEIARQSTDGDMDAWLMWVVSSVNLANEGPASFVLPMPTLLADSGCGIITPRRYYDLSVLTRAEEAVECELTTNAYRNMVKALLDEVKG